MSRRLIAVALAGAVMLPAAAHAQSRVSIPEVELFATVTGKWVLDPRRCPDIREDVRDARTTQGRRDRREDRRDQRIVDCPASAYSFVVAPGQGPRFPVRVGEGRIPRAYQGRPLFLNGGTIGEGGRPLENAARYQAPLRPTPAPVRRYTSPQYTVPQPTYQPPRTTVQPTYTPPVYTAPTVPQPTYTQPTTQQTYTQPAYTRPTYTQPTYTQPTYTQPSYTAPTPAPAPAPSQPSNYEVRNGVIYFLD